MSDTSNLNTKPPFRGFTDIFKRVNEKKEDQQSVAADEVVPSPETQKFDHNELTAKQAIENEELPAIIAPPPITYDEWLADRIKAAVIRCQELYGPINESEQTVDRDIHRLIDHIRSFTLGHRPSSHDHWCRCVDCQMCDENREDLHKRCNVNTFPQTYEFQLLNRRLRRVITHKNDPHWLHEFVQKSILDNSIHEDRELEGTYDRYAAEREELTQHINKRLYRPPSKKLNFRPQNLGDWRARFSFNIDKKYRYLPQVLTHANQNFQEWFEGAKYLLDRKRNKEAIKEFRNRIEMSNTDFREEDDSQVMSSYARRPSLSHCCSDCHYNGR